MVPTDSKLTRMYLMFLFTWQALFRVSDVGMNILLAFIATFLKVLVSGFRLANLEETVKRIPRNIYTARKYVGGGHIDRFMKYASCPKCHHIYPIDSCKVILPDKTVVSAKCTNVVFPHHPQWIRRSPCDSVLMKQVKTPYGTTSLYPRQMYCYECNRITEGTCST